MRRSLRFRGIASFAQLASFATLVSFATLGGGCDSCNNDRANVTTTGARDAAPADAAVTVAITPSGAAWLPPAPTDALVQFLPRDGAGGFKRIVAGTRPGYAEAKLEKDGKEVAILSITDAERLAYARARFDDATEKVGNVPVLKAGDRETVALVKDRYQLKVFSTTLDHAARKGIVASFDLDGLSR